MAATIFRVVLGVVVAGGLLWLGVATLKKFTIAPPAEPDPDDVKPVNLHYRCTVCGAEVTMTAAQGDAPEPPRHCREDMELVG